MQLCYNTHANQEKTVSSALLIHRRHRLMNPILDYFNLNRRINIKPVLTEGVGQPSSEGVIPAPPPSINTLPFSAPLPGKKPVKARDSIALIPVWQQGVFYLGTVVGVLFSSSIMQFQAGREVTTSFTVITILLSAVIALILMPSIYEQAIKPQSPFIVQLGLFVQAGVFWSVVFTTIGRTFG
jgi:hypothetical protein